MADTSTPFAGIYYITPSQQQPSAPDDVLLRMKTFSPQLQNGSYLRHDPKPGEAQGEIVIRRSQEWLKPLNPQDAAALANEPVTVAPGQTLPFPEAAKQEALRSYNELTTYMSTLKGAIDKWKADGSPKDKWIALIAPDKQKWNKELIYSTMANAPADAGVIFMAGYHKFEDFMQLPVASQQSNLTIPTRLYQGQQAMALRPEMAEALYAALEENLKTQAEKGGISPLDHVLTALQARILGANPVRPEYAPFIEAFGKANNTAEAKNAAIAFYAMNPLPLADARGQKPVVPVSLETAKAVREHYLRIVGAFGEKSDQHTEMQKAVIDYVTTQSGITAFPNEKALLDFLDDIPQGRSKLKASSPPDQDSKWQSLPSIQPGQGQAPATRTR